ncbi:MAG: acetate--CoA ligase family protein [Deltaproteobacteria bacterium]|nr:acetate--CoA ligase family protein [Deltaproteobacteria bacterium]
MTKNREGLDYFFKPESMVIVGASDVKATFGTRYLQAMMDIGFKGRLYAVNYKGDETLGLKIYRSVMELPDTPELACICVSAKYAPDVLRECLKKGVKAAIILSAGFSEYNEEGRRLEREIVDIARQGIRVMGPNCFGTYCPAGRVTVVPGGHFPKEAGGVALLTQSGQLAEGITAPAFGEGIRYSKVASYGNACNTNEADLLEYLMQDDETQVFSSYLEGVRDGRRFFNIARANRGKKPIIIWKVGLTNMGAAAASSHTGSLAGAAIVWDTFFKQTGAIRVETREELIDTSIGFSCLHSGTGPGVAFISGGGAGTVIGADACENAGMHLPSFSAGTAAKLNELLPSAGTIAKNPLDIGTPHPPLEQFTKVLEALAESEGVDVIVIRRIFFAIKAARYFAGAHAPSSDQIEAIKQVPVTIKQKYNKPVVIILPEDLTGTEDIDLEQERRELRDFYFRHGIPVFRSERRTFTALGHLVRFRSDHSFKIDVPALIDTESKGRALFLDTIKNAGTLVLDEIKCKKILKQYGIESTEPVLCKTPDEAVQAADDFGYPVVMKIISPEITHKSDIGAVRLNLKTSDEVKASFNDIMAISREKAPNATLEGLSVQRMAEPGLELVIGMTKDPQFGPMVMFGMGGTLVEVLKDIAFRIVPLSREDASEMIKETKVYTLMKGYRGKPPVDISYLEELLINVSAMVKENPEIKEMDINPLFSYEKGAIAVDARIILEPD